MSNYRRAGMFTEEVSLFSPIVTEVEISLPVFIGYTEKAEKFRERDLILVPTKINSLKDFQLYFGHPFEDVLEISVAGSGSDNYSLVGFQAPKLQYLLYYSLQIYFENGGVPCVILSVGTYLSTRKIILEQLEDEINFGLLDGLNRLVGVPDLSLIVIPEAIRLSAVNYAILVQAVLHHCQAAGNRFAIFDLYDGDNSDPDLTANRGYFGVEHLSFGSAYYPFIQTSMNFHLAVDESNVIVKYEGVQLTMRLLKEKNKQLYKFVKGAVKKEFVVLPPSGVVVSTYVKTDKSRGVWKSPANLALKGVKKPVVNMDSKYHDLLNQDPDEGKSFNSIRTFKGRGALVWGAKTLAGNDDEWQYISVRRFFLSVEESLKRSICWAVFEPNDLQTWSNLNWMIENYLTLKWQEGALAGVTRNQAFYVKCGLGISMSDRDIQEGRIIVEVGLAILRPAEFIISRISCQCKNL